MKSRVSQATVAVAAVLMLLAATGPARAEWNKGLEAYKQKDWATAPTTCWGCPSVRRAS